MTADVEHSPRGKLRIGGGWLGLAVAASLLARGLLFDFESGDYRGCLSPWYDYFVEHGRWSSLGEDFSNYYVPYLCLLSLSTWLPIPKLYAIKLISIAFDFLAAWLVFRIVKRKPVPDGRAWAAAAGVLFLPTVLMNSALWGQCDIIYSAALLAVLLLCRPCDKLNSWAAGGAGSPHPALSPRRGWAARSAQQIQCAPSGSKLSAVLPLPQGEGRGEGEAEVVFPRISSVCTLEQHPLGALVAFGVAMAFKPQAIFLGPFLGGLFLKGILPWRYVWVPVATYGACGLPAVIAGKPVGEVLLHWLRQENLPDLTAGATNLYQWLPAEPHQFLWWLGVALAGISGLGVMVSMNGSSRRKEARISAECRMQSDELESPSADGHGTGLNRDEWLVTTALLSVLAMPFFLPGMHERYFFPADLFALVYAFYFPRRWFVALWVQAASALTYLPYLFNWEPVPRPVLSVAMAAALAVVAHDYFMAIPRQPSALRLSRV